MGKIIKLKEVKKFIKLHTSTLVGGVFDLFHLGHLRYLKSSSTYSRPLVIIQTDRTASYWKGFNRPIIGQNKRAEIADDVIIQLRLSLEDLRHGRVQRFLRYSRSSLLGLSNQHQTLQS